MESYDMFSTVKIGSLSLKNRLAMAPMTRNRAGEGNVPQDLNAKYYEQRAGAGLLITEASQISPQGVGYPGTPGIHSKEQVEGWKKVTQAVNKKGAKIFCQLMHTGRVTHPLNLPAAARVIAPSAIGASEEMYLSLIHI